MYFASIKAMTLHHSGVHRSSAASPSPTPTQSVRQSGRRSQAAAAAVTQQEDEVPRPEVVAEPRSRRVVARVTTRGEEVLCKIVDEQGEEYCEWLHEDDVPLRVPAVDVGEATEPSHVIKCLQSWLKTPWVPIEP